MYGYGMSDAGIPGIFYHSFPTSRFYNCNLLIRKPVKFVHPLVDLLIRRCNLPLDNGLLLVSPCLGKAVC